MPELKGLTKIDVKMHMMQINGHYDVILGRDVLSKLRIVLDFEQQFVCIDFCFGLRRKLKITKIKVIFQLNVNINYAFKKYLKKLFNLCSYYSKNNFKS